MGEREKMVPPVGRGGSVVSSVVVVGWMLTAGAGKINIITPV